MLLHPPRLSLERTASCLLPSVPDGCALAPVERRILAAVADVVKEGAPVALCGDRVARNVDTFLAASHSRRAWRVRILLYLLEFLPLTTTGRRLTSLAPEHRSELIRKKFRSARGLWWIAAKARYLVLMGLYGDESASLATGFVPPERRSRYAGNVFPGGPGNLRRMDVQDRVGP